MNKEIEKAKTKLDDLKKERERKEVRYNTHAIIVEGARLTLMQCEDRSKTMIDELSTANINVGSQEQLLKELINKYQEDEQKKESDE